MKVEFLLTIRLTPDTRQELIETFGANYRDFREHVEKQIAEGQVIQIPAQPTQVRWLLDSGRCDTEHAAL